MGNGAYGQCGDRGKGAQGIWGTWPMRPTGGIGYRVWATWAIGHMANGAHEQWGLWAMGPMGNGAHGPMGDLDIFANNFINTGWILTKILLDIDIDVFYLNTGRFFHDGFI